MENKVRSFFYDQVKATFLPFETYEIDAKAVELADALKARLKKMKMPYDGSYALCELFVYTVDLEFNWKDDCPEEYRALEEWWSRVKSTEDFVGNFLFFAKSVHNQMIESWWEAKKRAHAIWKPVEEKSPDDQSEEEKSDPNSQSDNGSNAPK